MNGPDKISAAFDEYVVAFRRGEGDPTPFLERFEGEERLELELMVDGFLDTAPISDFDPSGVPDPGIRAITDSVMTRFDGRTGALSELLRNLRGKLRLKQTDVVGELASSFNANEAETEKIDGYYHDIEWGTLPAAGINDSVYESLARIFKTKASALKEAAGMLGPGAASDVPGVYARLADDAGAELEIVADMAVPPPSGTGRRADPPDRIDELFTGG